MSLQSRTSTLIDIPGLLNSVEKLQELGYRMRKEEMGFKSQDVDNVDIVIDAIHESYEECKKLHEKLETETIQASILRHRLQFLPGQIEKQIQAAIKSAKQSNSNEVERLQCMVMDTTDNIDDLENEFKDLEADNARLHPERDRVRQEHEEIVSLLNQRMAEKASKQIKLNETRDKLRETNQKILDLEDDIMNLKEDLIQERAEARMEKKRLKKAVYDTTTKTRDQKETNAQKKKELDALQVKVRESEDSLQAVRDSIIKYDRSRNKLEAEVERLTQHLEQERIENKQLEEKGRLLTKQLAQQEEDFVELKKNLEQQIKKLDGDIKYERGQNKEYSESKKEFEAIVEEKEAIRREDQARVDEQNAFLQDLKRKLAYKAEDNARFVQSNHELEVRIAELADTHEAELSIYDDDEFRVYTRIRKSLLKNLEKLEKGEEAEYEELSAQPPPPSAIMAGLAKSIEEHRTQLVKERKERKDLMRLAHKNLSMPVTDEEMRLQEERDGLQSKMDDAKNDTTQALQEFNQRIKDGKQQHDQLSQEGSRLHKSLKETEAKISALKVEHERAQKEFKEIKAKREQEIATLKTEIEEMQTEKVKKESLIALQEPGFRQLEKDFIVAEQEYEAQKKQLVAFKNKKLGLDDAVKQMRREMEKAERPMIQHREELKKKRDEALKQLKNTTEELRQMEQDIFDMGCKLKTAIEENARFEDANRKIEAEIESMNKQMDESNELLERLRAEFKEFKAALEGSWNSDKQMEAIFTMRDERLLKQMGELLEKTGNREGIVHEIGKKLNEELQGLEQFLKDVEERRPTGSEVNFTPMASTATADTPLPPGVRPPSRPVHPRPHPSSSRTPGSSAFHTPLTSSRSRGKAGTPGSPRSSASPSPRPRKAKSITEKTSPRRGRSPVHSGRKSPKHSPRQSPKRRSKSPKRKSPKSPRKAQDPAESPPSKSPERGILVQRSTDKDADQPSSGRPVTFSEPNESDTMSSSQTSAATSHKGNQSSSSSTQI